MSCMTMDTDESQAEKRIECTQWILTHLFRQTRSSPGLDYSSRTAARESFDSGAAWRGPRWSTFSQGGPPAMQVTG